MTNSPDNNPPCKCGHPKSQHKAPPVDRDLSVCSECDCITDIWMDPERRKRQEDSFKYDCMTQKVVVGTREDITDL